MGARMRPSHLMFPWEQRQDLNSHFPEVKGQSITHGAIYLSSV